MNDDRSTDLLSALPRTRPHRRSEKRAARPAEGNAESSPRAKTPTPRSPAPARKAPKPSAAQARKAPKPARRTTGSRKPARRPSEKRLRQPAQPQGIPSARRASKRKPAPTTGAEIVGTAVQAVGELAEIGVALGARALRNAFGRLPRP